MIGFFKKNITNHLSLFVLIFGAASFFFTNLLLKEKLNRHEYGKYSIVITFFSLVFIYGLLGFEQVFLRHSRVLKSNNIVTQKTQIQTIFIVLILTTFLSVFLFNYFYQGIIDSVFLLTLATICTSAISIFFAIFRLNENFVFAQFISNAFKFFLFTLVLVLILINQLKLSSLLYGALFSSILVFMIATLVFIKKIKIWYNDENTRKTIVNSFFYFFIAITSFSLINFCDRFIIESKFGYEKTGDYFYLTNIFLAPFAILQNYIGFKKLIIYKKHFDIKIFTKSNKKIILFGILLSIFLFICFMGIDYLNVVSFKFHEYTIVILLLLVSGTIRLYSLSINSAFDVVTNSANLKKANVIIFCFTILILYFTTLYLNTIELIIVSMIMIWILRAFVLNTILINQIKKESDVK